MTSTIVLRKQVEHVAGEYEGGIQRCVICGGILFDYRGAYYPSESGPPKGFPPGPIYYQGKNPTSISSELFEGYEIVKCN